MLSIGRLSNRLPHTHEHTHHPMPNHKHSRKMSRTIRAHTGTPAKHLCCTRDAVVVSDIYLYLQTNKSNYIFLRCSVALPVNISPSTEAVGVCVVLKTAPSGCYILLLHRLERPHIKFHQKASPETPNTSNKYSLVLLR